MLGGTRVLVVLAVAAVADSACHHDAATGPTALAIQCAAIPPAGAAPLLVTLRLDVQNARGSLDVGITYGDGAQGSDPAAHHVYLLAGDYVASITVSAGGETARCSMPISVTPGGEPNPTSTSGNQWPEPSFHTTPPADGSTVTGKAPLAVAFNMCRSVDPDGDRLGFRMDLDGDGLYEFFGATGNDCRREALYPVGTQTATICVTDLDCPGWPLCDDYPRNHLHPYQCMSYTVIATP